MESMDRINGYTKSQHKHWLLAGVDVVLTLPPGGRQVFIFERR